MPSLQVSLSPAPVPCHSASVHFSLEDELWRPVLLPLSAVVLQRRTHRIAVLHWETSPGLCQEQSLTHLHPLLLKWKSFPLQHDCSYCVSNDLHALGSDGDLLVLLLLNISAAFQVVDPLLKFLLEIPSSAFSCYLWLLFLKLLSWISFFYMTSKVCCSSGFSLNLPPGFQSPS